MLYEGLIKTITHTRVGVSKKAMQLRAKSILHKLFLARYTMRECTACNTYNIKDTGMCLIIYY